MRNVENIFRAISLLFVNARNDCFHTSKTKDFLMRNLLFFSTLALSILTRRFLQYHMRTHTYIKDQRKTLFYTPTIFCERTVTNYSIIFILSSAGNFPQRYLRSLFLSLAQKVAQ